MPGYCCSSNTLHKIPDLQAAGVCYNWHEVASSARFYLTNDSPINVVKVCLNTESPTTKAFSVHDTTIKEQFYQTLDCQRLSMH
ncbi:MAG: hypothetical protein HWE26_07245 [Alteromonadaceae bacterium]|nr:hypothetical protein [Alteromonadaceae bacterium]